MFLDKILISTYHDINNEISYFTRNIKKQIIMKHT